MKRKINSYVVSDCTDENARARYIASFQRELGGQVTNVSVKNTYEAGGCAVDIIDELRGSEAVVFVNVAPRKNLIKDEGHKNGRPFCYFKVGKTIVITSLEQDIFGIFQKVGIDFSKLFIIDLFAEKDIPQNTQFRSAQCIPVIAKKIFAKKLKSNKIIKNYEVQDLQDCVWFVDNFGNCKTTLTKFSDKAKLEKVERLADVKDNQQAQIIGSSGFKEKRFVEFVIGGCQSFAQKNQVKSGDLI